MVCISNSQAKACSIVLNMSRFSQYQETMKDSVYKCVDAILKTKMMYQPENV